MSNALKPGKHHAAVPQQRHGEGVSLDMQISAATSVHGQAGTVLVGSLASLPVPDRRYSADTCSVSYVNETVYVLFGQLRLFGHGLRTMLAVKMTPASVKIYMNSLGGGPSMESVAAPLGIAAEALLELDEEPSETVTLAANIVMAGISGREGCMDFYYASPFSKNVAAQAKKLAVDPVVRVDVRTSLVLGLNDKLAQIIEGLPQNLIDERGPITVG